MKVKYLVMGFMAVMCMLSSVPCATAEVHKIRLYCETMAHNKSPEQRLYVSVEIADTLRRPPDAIKSLKVFAPNAAKTVIDLTNHCWLEWDNSFWKGLTAADFPEGKIPSGTYTAVAVDKQGKTISTSENLSVGFLKRPEITSITEGQTVTTLTPRVSWTAVAGAQLYRIRLMNVTDGSPVYYPPYKSLLVYRNSYPIPNGVLVPGTEYSIQVEARDSDKNLNKRSRSDWVNFKTPSATTSTADTLCDPEDPH